MNRVAMWCLVVALQVIIAPLAWSEPFLMQGSRPLAMGGAFVAIAEDAVGASWNPAGYAKQKQGFDLELPLAIKAIATADIVKELDEVSKIGYQQIRDAANTRTSGSVLSPDIVRNFFKLLDGIDDLNKKGMGILATLDLGLNLRMKNYGFSVVTHSMCSGDPNTDLQNINLGQSFGTSGPSIDKAKDSIYALVGTGADMYGTDTNYSQLAASLVSLAYNITGTNTVLNQDQAESLIKRADEAGLSFSEIDKYTNLVTEIAAKLGTGTFVSLSPSTPTNSNGTNSSSAFGDNQSALVLKGAAIAELMMTYAQSYQSDRLSLGFNLKYMQAIMGYQAQKVFEEDVEEQVKDVLDKDTKVSSSFGLDLGALYELNKKTILGLVIKNINSPSFAYPEKANLPKYKIKPQVRVGLAYKPLNWLTLALDSDLTKNETILEGFDSKILSAGGELNIFNRPAFNLALRVGLMKNMAEDEVGSIFTCGLGLNLLHCHLNLAGLVSTRQTEIESGDKVPRALGGSLQLAFNF